MYNIRNDDQKENWFRADTVQWTSGLASQWKRAPNRNNTMMLSTYAGVLRVFHIMMPVTRQC